MTQHEARVALARQIARDVFQYFFDINIIGNPINQHSYRTIVNCREYIIYWLKPFFVSNDIEDVKVRVLQDKDNFYPTIVIDVIAKNQASYVKIDFKTTFGEQLCE